MKNKLIHISAVFFVLLLFVTRENLQASTQDSQSEHLTKEASYLPVILFDTSVSLTEQLERAIQEAIEGTDLDVEITDVDFDQYTLSLHFTVPSAHALQDNHEFEDLLIQSTIAVDQLLADKEFDIDIFLNGEMPSFAQPALQDSDRASRPQQISSIAGEKIVLSPGHGWHEASNGSWRLDRGYHWGIVEDFINADLILQLHNKMLDTNATLLSPRQLNRNVGNHSPSNYPWWQMGAGEYVRSLDAPGSVWGQGFSGYDRNIVAPPEYANWVDADMLVSIHNNGSNGQARGTLIMYDTSNGYQDSSRRLAELIEDKLVQRIREQWDPNWYSFGARGYSRTYGENRRFNGPAVIIELAFMDNQADNAALQDATFRNIATEAIKEAILEYYDASVPSPSPPKTFVGNVNSSLRINNDGASLDYTVCADNLSGHVVYAQLTRPNSDFSVVSQYASSRCVTFINMDGDGSVLVNTPYTVRAALNQPPNRNWPVPCFTATSGRGLCDTASFSNNTSVPILEASSSVTIDTASVNLQVCGNNIENQTVYVQMWRDSANGFPPRTWNTSSIASNNCIVFEDLDGPYDTFANVTYYTVASLTPIGNGEAQQKRVSCYASTNQERLCDSVRRDSGLSNVFQNGVSDASVNAEAVTLEVCGNNIAGRTVYVQMWRDASNGYPARTWNYSQNVTTGNCTVFQDIDGYGNVFANTEYYTVAALEPIGATEAAQKRTACYFGTGETRLCDVIVHTQANNKFVNGSSTATITTSAVNLQVCGNNINGRTVYVQMWRDASNGYPANTWNTSQTATSNCINFNDLDGVGNTFTNTEYYIVAALEPIGTAEAAQKRTACYYATGEARLCDMVVRNQANNVFVNGSSTATITTSAVNLQVCGDNINGRTVYVQMWRDASNGYPANTWNTSQTATSNCISVNDLDGVGNTFTNTEYYTVVALEPIGATEAAQKPTACYYATGETRLCDMVVRNQANNVFVNGSSTATITTSAVNLQVCGDNINGRTVYVQMWRDASNGYPANTWNTFQTVTSNCINFNDLDGAGNTFTNTEYYTVASLEPIGATEAAQKRTACYYATGETRLCDMVIR